MGEPADAEGSTAPREERAPDRSPAPWGFGWLLFGIGLLALGLAYAAPGAPLTLVAAIGLLAAVCWRMFQQQSNALARLRRDHAALTARVQHQQDTEGALRASEQRFQDVAHASGDWFWETDAQGRFTWISDSVEHLTGLPPASHYGKTRAELAVGWGGLDAEPWRAHLQTLQRRESFRDFQYQRRFASGQRWISTSGVPRFDAQGTFLGYRGAASDITRHRQAADEARHANAQLRAAVEELGETFLLTDAQERIVVANRRLRELNAAVVPLIEAGCSFETFVREGCAHGYYPEAIGRVDEFVRTRLAQRRNPGPAVELHRADGRCILLRDWRLPGGATITVGMDITERHQSELALRESELRLQAMFTHSPAALAVVDMRTGVYREVNAAWSALTGRSAAEVVGRGSLDFGLFADPVARDAMYAALQRDGLVHRAEHAIVRSDGERRLCQFFGRMVTLQSATLSVFWLIDVTDRRRAEDELRASRRLLEQVIDALPMSIFAKDTQSNYIMVNREFARVQGASREALLHRHTSALPVPQASRAKSLADDAWVFAHRKVLDQPVTQLEGHDGQWIPFHSTKIPLLDDDGTLIGLLGINRDVTEELRAQANLRASEARFSALFHQARVPQLVSDPVAGSIEDVNQAFCELLGHPASDLIGPAAPSGLSTFCAAQPSGTVQAQELALTRADGAQRVVLASAFTIATVAGERLAWSLHDVTDQRAAQQQMQRMNQTLEHAVTRRTEQLTHANAELRSALAELQASQEALLRSEKLAALGRIVAGVAHELNTPIGNGLLSATTLAHHTEELAGQLSQGLRRSALEQYMRTSQDVLAILLRNLHRAAELVGSFKQVAADQASSQRRRFDLKTVVDEVLLSHRPTLRGAHVEVQVQVPPQLLLDSYPGPLGQVLGNLLDNAVLHGYEGREAPCLVWITAAPCAPASVRLCVRDEGHGIAAQQLRRIFDPFFTTRLGRGGSGLGLHIVHNIVTGPLGGSIAVQSEPGRGASFTITLPLQAPAPAAGTQPAGA